MRLGNGGSQAGEGQSGDPGMPFITSKKILEAYHDYGFFGLIVWGPLRSGKSSFAIQLCAEVYGLLNDPNERWRKMIDLDDKEWVEWVGKATKAGEVRPDWNAWKKWMVFKPIDFFERVHEAQRQWKQLPLLVWDDAGLWASHYRWKEEFGVRLAEYFNVAASDYAGLIFTTPHPMWLLKQIRDVPGAYHGRIIREEREHHHWSRRIRVYDRIIPPDYSKIYPKGLYEERYNVLLPPEVFREYDDVRRTYAWIAKERAMEIVKRIMRKYGREKAAQVRQRLQEDFGIVLPENNSM